MATLLSHRIFARSILAQRQDRQAATGPEAAQATRVDIWWDTAD